MQPSKLCGLRPLQNVGQVTRYRTLIADVLEHEDCFSPADTIFCKQLDYYLDAFGVEAFFTVFTQRWFQRLERQLSEVLDVAFSSDL